MAITATFYKNDKKINSTKQPVPSADDITLSVELKDVVDLFTPSLVISADVFMSGDQIVNPMKYNYCYLPDFERYYFVRTWSWIVGRWECALEVDVLATFKTQIGNTNAFVLRAYSQYDPDIVDTKYPTSSDVAGALQVANRAAYLTPWSVNIKNASMSEGFYVISIVNDDDSAVGGVSHYALSASTMGELMNKLFSAPTWMNIVDANISEDMQKMLFNPMQYITSCMWIPTGYGQLTLTGVHTIPFGWWSLTLTGWVYRIEASDSAIDIQPMEFPIATHPQNTYGKRNWLQLSPYTTMALYFPPFGFIPIDTTKVYMCDSVKVKVRVDVITGRGEIFVSNTYTLDDSYEGGLIYTSVAQVGVPVSIAQMAVSWDMLSSASTWIMAAGVSLATGGLQESMKNLQNGIVNGVRDIFSKSSGRQALTDGFAATGFGSLLGSTPTVKDKLMAGSNFSKNLGSGTQRTANDTSLLSTIKEIAGDIGSTALAAAGTCSSSGSSGGFASLSETCILQHYFLMITGVDDEHNGLPLCRKTLIRNLSGFVLCGNADDFTANCTPAERQAVLGLLEAGFYYE